MSFQKMFPLALILALAVLLPAPVFAVSSMHNPANGLDVDNNNLITPLDALLIINRLQRAESAGVAVPLAATSGQTLYWDTNNDSHVSPIDALLVINQLQLVPEPSTLVSAGLGLASLALLAWRRRRGA